VRLPACGAVIVVVDDAQLVRAAQAGDADAFEVLVRRHQERVFRVALRMLGDPVDAEDATQDTLIQAWLGLPGFRGRTAFSTWLYRIVVNRCLNLLAARRPAFEIVEVSMAAVGEPAEEAQMRERLAAVVAAIVALPGEQRAALVLRELEGLSYEDIATVLGVSVAAVKGRLHRARGELARRLRA
jgi:RNA polymerase sigma-70 factor, ECF subfamily